MLTIKDDKFDRKVNLDELVSLLYAVKKKSQLLEENETQLEIQKELERLREKFKFLLFRAYKGSQLSGFILLLINTPKFGILWDWNPVVLPDENEINITRELLMRCIESAKKRDITRLEVCFAIESEAHKYLYSKQVDWYKAIGFKKLTEEVNMRFNLEKFIPHDMRLPNKCKIETLDLVNQALLPQIAYLVFNNSEDTMFLDLGEDEKRVMCEKYFDLTQQIVQDASYILKEGDEIIGFSIIRGNGEETQLTSLGIVPKRRNKGLAKGLLLLCLEKLREKGFRNVYLDVVVENVPAYNLYTKIGFKLINSTIIYALICRI